MSECVHVLVDVYMWYWVCICASGCVHVLMSLYMCIYMCEWSCMCVYSTRWTGCEQLLGTYEFTAVSRHDYDDRYSTLLNSSKHDRIRDVNRDK